MVVAVAVVMMVVVGGGNVVTYLRRPRLSPVTCFKFSLKPTDSTSLTSHLSAAAPSVCNTLTCTHGYKNTLTHSTQMSLQWTQQVCCFFNSILQVFQTGRGSSFNSRHGELSFSPASSWSFITWDQQSLWIYFCLGTWNDNEGRGEYVTLQCADWTYRNCQGTTTAGSWDSSGSHFGLIESGQWTNVGGDWEVNKQQVCQQYSPVDMVSSWGEGNNERATVARRDVTQTQANSKSPQRKRTLAPLVHLQILPSLVAEEMDTEPFKRHSERLSYPRFTTRLNWAPPTTSQIAIHYK